MPIFGRAGDWENAYLAAGHFRNGILLTPISSEICLAMLLTGKTDIDPAFSPDRFKEI
jgi:glycine oxidase